MLVEFRVGNYRSFHHPQTLSLAAGRDLAHPGNLIACGKDNLLKAAAVFGANASGKSNLIKAFGFMRSFVRDSATRMNVGDKIPVVPFRLTDDSLHEPSLFEVILVLDKVRYQYGFTASLQRVHDEWLIAYPKGRPRRWFERRFDPQTQETRWAFRGDLAKQGDSIRDKTRDNGLILSRGAELNVDLLIPIFLWFRDSLRVMNLSDFPTVQHVSQKTAKRFQEDTGFRQRALRILQDADLGIKHIRVVDRQVGPDDLPKGLSEFLPEEVKRELFEVLGRRVESVHSVAGATREAVFNFEEAESLGTQRLFALTGPWLAAMRSAITVVVDELDCSMHPLLVRSLIALFQSPEWNPKGAQLIFATHDSTLMTQSLFRRDQIWLVEKSTSEASQLFSLYDFKHKPRKGEALEKGYLAGRYGAVPTLGSTFEDVEFD